MSAAAVQNLPINVKGENTDITISSSVFKSSVSTSTNSSFIAMEGHQIGLDEGYEYTIRDYTDPFWIGRGTAAGDYNQDGWQDIVFGTNHGFVLYQNVQGRFIKQAISNKKIKDFIVYAVAFVDLDNDGWLDLFFTTFNQGNFLILNKQGAFDYSQLISVPNNDAVLTLSPGFADIDGNGFLDIINGNVALGVVTGMHHMKSRRNNSIVFNQNLTFRDVPLERVSGETMASLVSDINNDGLADVYFGNDFIIPDKILLGTGRGFEPVKGNQFLPYTPFFSMGADTGDINNDLKLDFLVTGTMYMAPFVGESPIDGQSVADYSAFKGGVETCRSIKDPQNRLRCEEIRASNYIKTLDENTRESFAQCNLKKNKTEKDVCLTRLMWEMITADADEVKCPDVFAEDRRLNEVCNVLTLKSRRYDKRDLYGAIPQDDRNMLYQFDPVSQRMQHVDGFKHPGGWTWNSRIVDMNNDGWQDVITADGTVRSEDYGWNVYMENLDGQKFEQKQFSKGFVSDFGLYSFVLVDFDNDGDLDVIGNSAEGPVQVYQNSLNKNNSIAISLNDEIGNSFGIGAKVIIRYNNGKDAQIRELKASGGYMSFDPAIAWFGLQKVPNIDEIEITWSDGAKKLVSGSFQINRHYTVHRRAR